ncbi:MAG: hypothetical protein IT518_04565 [Burkholderiales bacterium]|nr:hypothetical protein [Burkholderiales bacterium]
MLLVAAAVLAGAGCDLFAEKVHRGRVIDQDTREPVPGAIVSGRYFGGVSWGGSSCNRAESTVSDAQGWFELPLDPKSGPLLLEGFKRGYVRGNRPLYAFPKKDGSGEWQVSIQKWNEASTKVETVTIAPEVYPSEAAAKAASGQDRDVFVRKAPADRDAHIRELWGYQKDCTGPPRSSDGLVPFLQEILKDQTELGDASGITSTNEWIEMARNPPPSTRGTAR